MRPTRADFARASTSPTGASFTFEQVRILGMDPQKEWLKLLIGTEIPIDVWNRFVQAGAAKRKKNYERIGRRLEDGPIPGYDNASRALSSGKSSSQPHPSELSVPLPSSQFVPEPKRRELFESEDWKFLRSYVLRKHQYTCQHCGTRNVRLHVDHKIPITVDWSRRLDLLNLQVLCEDCNVGKSNFFVG